MNDTPRTYGIVLTRDGPAEYVHGTQHLIRVRFPDGMSALYRIDEVYILGDTDGGTAATSDAAR